MSIPRGIPRMGWLDASGEIGEIRLGDSRHLAPVINTEVFCFPFYQGFPGFFAHYLISEADGTSLQGVQESSYRNHLVVPSGLSILTGSLGNHQTVSQFFQLEVMKTPLATIFRSAHFKPDEVIGVVDHPHTVGLRIADPQVKLHTIVIPYSLTIHLIHTPYSAR
jgi:hypothetical protein